jgi:hypothetical protein
MEITEMTTKEAANKWGCSVEMVRYLAKHLRIKGQYITTRGIKSSWCFPDDAEYPTVRNPRRGTTDVVVPIDVE